MEYINSKKRQTYGLHFKDAAKVFIFSCVIAICTSALLYYTDMWIKIVASVASSFILSHIILKKNLTKK